MTLDSAVRSATFLQPAERPILTNTLATVLTAYERPDSDAYGLVGAISFTIAHGAVSFRDVAEFMTDIAPDAAPAGISIEELMQTYAALTRQGMSSWAATAHIRATMLGQEAGA